MSWQHGGGGYAFWPMIPFIEFFNSDIHFVFSKKVALKYIETSQKLGLFNTPVFLPVGSSSLDNYYDKIRTNSHRGKIKNIVYITTHYEENFVFISHPFNPIGFDDNLWIFQKQIIDLARLFTEINIIIKLHPTHHSKEPLNSYANDGKYKNIQIISSEKTIPELLDVADLIIIDHITTGILQILTSNIPVFAYNGFSHVDSEAIESLKKRTYVYEDIETLITDLNKYITDRISPNPSVNYSNTDFILKYGTDISRLNSAEKAVQKIGDLINIK